MKAKILITGATGNVGAEVVEELKGRVPFRVGARDVDSARSTLGHNLEYTHFDFLDPSTYPQTFSSIERMFLVRPPALANVQRDIAPAVWAAVGAGVKHIVFLSLLGVEKNRFVPHHKIESLVRETGVAWTFLRAGFFMQNLSTTHRAEIKERGKIALPVGKAKISFIDVRDIAAVAAEALVADGHKNRAYALTGGEALDYYQVAETMSAVLGKPVRYTEPSNLRFVRQQLEAGRPLGFTLVMTGLYALTRFGSADRVTADVQNVLGRTPITLEQFIEDHRGCWEMGETSHDPAHK